MSILYFNSMYLFSNNYLILKAWLIIHHITFLKIIFEYDRKAFIINVITNVLNLLQLKN